MQLIGQIQHSLAISSQFLVAANTADKPHLGGSQYASKSKRYSGTLHTGQVNAIKLSNSMRLGQSHPLVPKRGDATGGIELFPTGKESPSRTGDRGTDPFPHGGRSHLLLEKASPYLHALAPARCGSNQKKETTR